MRWPWTRWQQARAQRDGPWAALFEPHQGQDWVAIDLETTGLDPRRDSLLSLAAVPGCGRRLYLRDRLELQLRCHSPRIAAQIRHHQFRPVDLAQGVDEHEALQRLLPLIGNRPLVGYCLAFDLAVLDRLVRPQFGFMLPNRRIDVRHLYRAQELRRHPLAVPDLRLETMLAARGLPQFDRHSALGDAVSAGLLYCALQPRQG